MGRREIELLSLMHNVLRHEHAISLFRSFFTAAAAASAVVLSLMLLVAKALLRSLSICALPVTELTFHSFTDYKCN